MSQTAEVPRIQEAAQIAIDFVKSLLFNEQLSDFRMEEFKELKEDGNAMWAITLSFIRSESLQIIDYLRAVPLKTRVRKIVDLEKETLRPTAMRNPPGA